MHLALPSPSYGDPLKRRLASAWAESISVRGYTRTTVQHIVELSGVSRSTFYGRFRSKEDAFVAVHAEALTTVGARIDVATAAEPDWPRKVAAGLASALQTAAGMPCEAQLLVGDPFAAGPRMGYCRDLIVARFAPGLAAGRRAVEAGPRPPSLEAGLLGSLVDVIGRRVSSGSADTLPALGPSLAEFVLTPYVGAAEAERVAKDASPQGPAAGDEFGGAFEDAFARLRSQVEAACADAAEDEWPVRVAAGIKAVFAFAADHPQAARLLTNEALARDGEDRRLYQRMISYFASLLITAREPCGDEGCRSGVAENAMAGGVALLVGRRLSHDREGELPAAASEAAQFILTPWVGTEQARRIASEHC